MGISQGLEQKLKFVDFTEGDMKSEQQANHHFYSINEDLLKELYYGRWIIIMKGGQIVNTYENRDALYKSLADPVYRETPKVCWKMLSEEELRKDPETHNLAKLFDQIKASPDTFAFVMNKAIHR
jgi:shikimate kinase